MSQSRFRSFLTGAFVGVGLGVLLTSKEEYESKNDLKTSFSLLIDTIKNIDLKETRENFLHKVDEIKKELSKIDVNTVKEEAEEKMNFIDEKCDELMKLAKEEKVLVVEKATKEVKEHVHLLIHKFLDELEEENQKKESQRTKKTRKKTSEKKVK